MTSHMHHAGFDSFWVSNALLLVALVYLRGWFHVRRDDHGSAGGWRVASFALGLSLIWIAAASPLATLDHELLTAHMVQHLLLMSFAAPLILFAAPLKLLQRGLPRRLVEVVVTPLSSSARARQMLKALTHPAVCWLGATCSLVGWHIPSFFALGMRSEMWHGIEHASFLTTGLLFWWPVIQPWPAKLRYSDWSILLYLFLATLPCDILSGFLVFCDRVVYPIYFSSSQPFGLSVLQDQECAGALMWTVVTVVFMIAGTVFAARLLSPQGSRERAFLPSGLHSSPVSQTARTSMEAL